MLRHAQPQPMKTMMDMMTHTKIRKMSMTPAARGAPSADPGEARRKARGPPRPQLRGERRRLFTQGLCGWKLGENKSYCCPIKPSASALGFR